MAISRYCLIFCFLLISVPTTGKTLTIAVASNFYHSLSLLADKFEQQTGAKIKLASGSSGLLYAQIVKGAPYDVLFSADKERPEKLESLGYGGYRQTYTLGVLALWVPDNNGVLSARFLADYDEKLAIANPRFAPYGKASEQVISALKLTKHYQNRFILGNNISQTFQFVESGNAKAGMVALSLIKFAENKKQQNLNYWLVPQHFYQPIEQQAIVLNRSKNIKLATDFIEFVLLPDNQQLLQALGYGALALLTESLNEVM